MSAEEKENYKCHKNRMLNQDCKPRDQQHGFCNSGISSIKQGQRTANSSFSVFPTDLASI